MKLNELLDRESITSVSDRTNISIDILLKLVDGDFEDARRLAPLLERSEQRRIESRRDFGKAGLKISSHHDEKKKVREIKEHFGIEVPPEPEPTSVHAVLL